jgi:hypothetical protein
MNKPSIRTENTAASEAVARSSCFSIVKYRRQWMR